MQSWFVCFFKKFFLKNHVSHSKTCSFFTFREYKVQHEEFTQVLFHIVTSKHN